MLDGSFEVDALLTLFVSITMAAFLLFCVCGCRAKERKEELVGVEGHVKMRNPEVETEVNANVSVATEVTSSAKRSLPDLPVDSAAWETNGDGASELYATVDKQPDKREIELPSPPTRPEHPYDKVRRVEHPYAQVSGTAPSSSNAPDTVNSSGNIPAATAIAGHVHASDDLPYMTPPPHFSGDSQDSTKGYTSISVREPLAEILAESRRVGGSVRTAGDYATLSDDSDDMYAAIEDPASGSETYAQIAQPTAPPPQVIPPQESTSIGASTSTINSPKPDKREAKSPLPAPPASELLAPPTLDDMYAKVNKKRRRDLEDAFQRGASTESGSSESVSYRIQSNASCTESNHSCHSHPTTETSSSSAASRSHACCTSHSTTDTPSSRPQDGTDSSLSSDGETHGSYERLDPPYETVSCKHQIKAQTNAQGDPGYERLDSQPKALDPGYETLSSRLKHRDPGYETLGMSNEKDPGYETLGGIIDIVTEPCYETLESQSFPGGNDPGYETLGSRARREHGYEPLRSSYELNGTNDPTYETLGRGSDSDPNYERIGGIPHEDGYALVVKRKHSEYEAVKYEPPYTSLEPREPPYSSLDGGLEPPYSSLGPVDPPYTSLVHTDSSAEPPYQRLADCESGTSDK